MGVQSSNPERPLLLLSNPLFDFFTLRLSDSREGPTSPPHPPVASLLLSYVYLSMSNYFSRDDQALPGFAAHFAKESEEEREHGMKLMAYQSKRGGRCVFQDIAKPVSMEWGSCLEAMEAALELEKMVNQSLLEITKAADAKADSHLSDFVDEFLEDQVAS